MQCLKKLASTCTLSGFGLPMRQISEPRVRLTRLWITYTHTYTQTLAFINKDIYIHGTPLYI